MMTAKIHSKVTTFCEEEGIFYTSHAHLQNYTTFRIGGQCPVVVEPKSEQEIQALVRLFVREQITYFPMSKGSNTLFLDEGFDGVLLRTENLMCKIFSPKDGVIHAEAGVRLIDLAQFAYEQELDGLQFAYGIPGAVGGGVFMNAGAYTGEMKQVVSSVRFVDHTGELCEISGESLSFGYRKSYFSEHGGVIVSAQFELPKGDKAEIHAEMEKNWLARLTKQPLEFPSAGSVFKRPIGGYASALIDAAGLKGRRVGGAQVSEKHGGFIINRGGATYQDVVDLIAIIQEEVEKQTGILLEPELRVISKNLFK